MTELDGMAKLTEMTLQQQWPHTMDAQIWAEEFVKNFPSIELDAARAWFANAIMAGYDTAMMRKPEALKSAKDRVLAHDAEQRAVIEQLHEELTTSTALYKNTIEQLHKEIEQYKQELIISRNLASLATDLGDEKSKTITRLREALEALTTGECGSFLKTRFGITLKQAQRALKETP
ncbi:MAG TPA: hypothetical protein VF780_05750 [Nitrosospira sp.]